MTPQNDFIGRWKLDSCTGTCGNKRNHPLGENPFGTLFYTRQYMIAFIAGTHRSSFDTNDIRAVPLEQIGKDFPNFETYCGRYIIDHQKSMITHFVESGKVPNHIGTEFRRHFKFEGKKLILQSATELLLDGAPWVFTLVWSKMESFD